MCQFAPASGKVRRRDLPGDPVARFDSAIFGGCSIPPFYDSMVGKRIVRDETRSGALAKLRQALTELRIEGGATTHMVHNRLACHSDVVAGTYSMGSLESEVETMLGDGEA